MSKQVVWPAIFYIRLAEFTFRMLEFENVSKSFWTGVQRKVILDRVSFKVELGTSLGILAPKRHWQNNTDQHDGRIGKT